MELGRGVVGREVKKMEEGGGARFYSDTLVSNTHSILFLYSLLPFYSAALECHHVFELKISIGTRKQ